MGRPGLTRHPKFRRLAHVLEREHPGFGEFVARGALEAVWDAAYENGDDFLGDALSVEAVAGWRGTPGALCAALVEAGGPGGVGFLEPSPDREGCFVVHDLWDHAPEYVQKRRTRELERQAKGAALRGDAGKRRTMSAERQTASSHRPPKSPTLAPAPAPAPALEKLSQPPAAAAPGRVRRKRSEPDPLHAPLVARLAQVFERVRGAAYTFDGEKDGAAVKRLLGFTRDLDEIARRWERALTGQGFFRVNSISAFAMAERWNAYAAEHGPAPPASLPPTKQFKGFENGKEIWE